MGLAAAAKSNGIATKRSPARGSPICIVCGLFYKPASRATPHKDAVEAAHVGRKLLDSQAVLRHKYPLKAGDMLGVEAPPPVNVYVRPPASLPDGTERFMMLCEGVTLEMKFE